jgi:general stress protein 26
MTDTVTHDDFWTRLGDLNAGMLSVGENRPIPMSHYPDRDANALWFITAMGTDIAQALASGSQPARYIVAAGKLYATIDGTASLSNDAAKLAEIWNAVADAWFEDGREDDDIALVRIDLKSAEVWATDGGLAFLYEIAKANLTDEKPDIGAHGTLSFTA